MKMEKEKLTVQNIKADIFAVIKTNIGHFWGITVLLAAMLALTIWMPLFILKLPCGLLAIIFLCVWIKYIFYYIQLLQGLRNTGRIVKDKLVGMELKEYYTRYGIRRMYELTFASFGHYALPRKNYTWSAKFSMSGASLYNYYIKSGDEFYLVLSKPHTGKIVFVYSTNMFELTP